MVKDRIKTIARSVLLLASVPALAQTTFFTPGNLVVSVEGCGVYGGTCTSVPNGTGNGTGNSSVGGYGDTQGAPITLFQYAPTGTASVTFVNSLVLPQNGSGANVPIAGEYGSQEATLQLSGAGQYLTIMGYGVNAAAFDASPSTYGSSSGALALSGSLTGKNYTAVPRTVTLIDANGNVNSSTAISNIFNLNAARSAFTLNGATVYVSGQAAGATGGTTGGVYYVPVGAADTSPTAITGLDATTNTVAQDTRGVQIYNNTLYVSTDSKQGSGNNRDFIGTLGSPPATGLYNSSSGPTQLTGFGSTAAGKEAITTGANSNGNNLNAAAVSINLSPVNYFFASPQVIYVADSGAPNNTSGASSLGDGGLQKWINSKTDGSGTWSLAYTLYQGLNLVANPAANPSDTSGTTGLYGLAGAVSGNNVYLYATNYTISDLDFTYLYGITDSLTFTTASQASGESFALLDAAPADSNFKGVSFAPTIPAGDVEVTSLPSGLAFTSAGTGCAPASYATPLTLTWTPASSCTLSVTTPQSGGTGIRYAFAHWEDGTTSTTHNVTAPATTATYTATFTTKYQLTTSAGTGGSVSGGGYFDSGTDATVTATPNTGYCFVNFTGTTTSTSNPLTLVMNAPQTITANFGQGIYSPTSGGTLAGASATFTWCVATNATAYWLDVGSTQGGNTYYQSGSLPTSTLSQTVTSLPSDGSTVWARWYYFVSGSWQFVDFSYTAFGGSASRGAITSPAPSSTLTGSSATFNWTAGSGANAYWLDVGSTAGGNQYFQSGNLGNVLTVTVNGLPTNGTPVYVTLYSMVNNTWLSNAYAYTAFNASSGLAVMQSPTPGSQLTTNAVTFTWSAGAGATAYWLDAGSTVGGNNEYQSGNLGNVLTTTAPNLPADGTTIYVTLYSLVGGQWVSNAYTYMAATGAFMQTPVPGSTLSGASQTFNWSMGTNVTAYQLTVGSTYGGAEFYSSGSIGVQMAMVSTLPANGSTVYVTLYSQYMGQWVQNYYYYVSGP